MAKPLADATKKKIVELLAKGLSGGEVSRKLGVSQATVSNVRNAKAGDVIAPAAPLATLATMSLADRVEAQLSTLDQVLLQPGLSPSVRSNVLRTYSSIIDKAAKLRQRDGRNERQFDGLADLLLHGTHADAARWSKDPLGWLADAVPRHLGDLHEIAGALERIPAEARKAHEGIRPILLRILTLLDAP